MEIKPGMILGERFEFRQHLASGGFGQVWEGFDRQLKRPIAVKRLLQDTFGKMNKSEVIGEAQRVAALNHPNVFGEHEGTLGYKSPEQLTGLKLDPRSDLFNGGLIAYLVFSAIHPFTDERFIFTHREMVLEPYRPTSPIARNTFPPDLGVLILRLLESKPARRFVSASQALSEFESVETAFKDLLQERCVRLHDALVSGAAPEAIDSSDLAAGISLLKQAGFYAQAKLLYEKGGLDLSQLSAAARNRVNEDYVICGRRLEKEGTPT